MKIEIYFRLGGVHLKQSSSEYLQPVHWHTPIKRNVWRKIDPIGL